MYVGAAKDRDSLREFDVTGGPAFKDPGDPRVTRLGRVLRRTSIDELPQLINVIRGEISLVGPRPLAIEDYDRRWSTIASSRTLSLVERRLRVKPGITGLWQVSGRSGIAFERWMELDEEYVSLRSLLLDLRILIRTIPAVLLMRGAL